MNAAGSPEEEAAGLASVRAALEAKLRGKEIVIENPNRRLARFAFCRRGEPSRLATRRYREIVRNVGKE